VVENRDIMEPHPEEYTAFIDELIKVLQNLAKPDVHSNVEPGGDRFRGLRGG
jgi:hypothetical protein